ncbi:MAG: gamma-glutamylcyclotransferase [Idiomarina sp.]|nr:gamma-glutamylcyclotransferase [Idiomarina sp.]
MYYFAYGSNMSSRRLLARVPSARSLGVAVLLGYEMSFRKRSHDGSAKCTILENPKASTLGVVYQLPDDQRYTLDRIEGQGFGYDVTDVRIHTQHGKLLNAFTYLGTDPEDDIKPYQWYVEHVVRGAREHGIACQYIDKILACAAIDDPDPGRQEFELSIYDDAETA